MSPAFDSSCSIPSPTGSATKNLTPEAEAGQKGRSAGSLGQAGCKTTPRNSATGALPSAPAIARGSFLVVDELGRLELLRGCGLTNAMALLDAGPTPTFPHALAVVRETLLDQAVRRFAPTWGTPRPIAPGDKARQLVLGAFEVK